jgi:hypothetical protein
LKQVLSAVGFRIDDKGTD